MKDVFLFSPRIAEPLIPHSVLAGAACVEPEWTLRGLNPRYILALRKNI